MTQQYSKAHLAAFLDTVIQKGLANTNTAAGWKAACGRILEDVADQDDVRSVDVPTAIKRYHNKHPGELAPSSLKEYERRLGIVIKEFVSYANDPAGYKARGRPPVKNSEGRVNGARRKPAQSTHSKEQSSAAGQEAVATRPQPIAGLSLEFPMRPDFLAQVVVPRDMKADEARRFTRFILTLAHDYSPPEESR